MTSSAPTAPTTADEMLAASARRAADYRPVILNDTPARRLSPRTRRHSVAHRAYR